MLLLPDNLAVIVAQNWRWRLAQYLEIRWWRRYLRKQPKATYLASKRAYWQRVLDQLEFSPEPGVLALEIGCGPAGLFVWLHNQQQITALDPLLDQYEAQLTHFSRADYPEVRFWATPLESAELKKTTFPLIYCFNAINHVADWECCLDKINQLAAPDAQLLISSDVHRRAWMRTIFRYLPGDALHPHQHMAKEYRQALQERGWRLEREVVLKPGKIFDYVGWVLRKI